MDGNPYIPTHIHTVCPDLTVLYYTGAKNESELIEHKYSHGCQNSCATSDTTFYNWFTNQHCWLKFEDQMLKIAVGYLPVLITCQLYTLTNGEIVYFLQHEMSPKVSSLWLSHSFSQHTVFTCVDIPEFFKFSQYGKDSLSLGRPSVLIMIQMPGLFWILHRGVDLHHCL